MHLLQLLGEIPWDAGSCCAARPGERSRWYVVQLQ
jgi:hypothetical protein